MDTISLKKHIFEQEKIEYVLEKIGCHNIKFHEGKNYYSCGNYNGDNKSAINVYNNEYLNVRNWTRSNNFNENADIITLVQYNKNLTFKPALKYIHSILNIPFTGFKKVECKEESNIKDPLEIFRRVRKRNKIDVSEIEPLDEDIINDYIPLLHIDWFREGIMPWTAKKFGLAYSYYRDRIVIPMRYWLTGELLGLNRRTTVKNSDLFGIRKYLITETYQKNLNLFGLYENYEAIQKAGYVVVYEAEKSVLKRDSLGDSTGVALSGHEMSDEQIRILVGLNVDIIISFDCDIDIDTIRKTCEKFYLIRNVYYTFDKYKILKEKESIADKPNKVFNYFFKYKIKYDKNEHEEYKRGCINEKNK